MTNPDTFKRHPAWKGLLSGAIALGCLSMAVAPAIADEPYPSKPIRLIVMYPAGGVVDLVGRAVSERMGSMLGQPIVVENKVGASGTVGFSELARAPADGYTLAMGVANMITNPILLPKVTKWKTADFIGIGQIGAPPNVFVTASSHPAKTLPQMVDYLKANAATASVSNPGIGTSNHLGQELFFKRTNLNPSNVLYKGQPAMVADIASGQVTLGLMTAALANAQIQKGTLKALAVGANARIASLPNTPTVAEAGFSDATYMPTYGIIARAGTPKAMVDKLSDAMQKAMASPEVISRLEKIGAVISPANAAQYDQNIAAEIKLLSGLIRDRNIRLPN